MIEENTQHQHLVSTHVNMHECKSGTHEHIYIHTEKKEKGSVE